MTPEEARRWNRLIGIMPRDEFDLVLKALEKHRNEALEEAATLCDKCKDQHWGPLLAAAIRALKSSS